MKKVIGILLACCVITFIVIGSIWAFAPDKVGEITLSFQTATSETIERNVGLYETQVSKGGKTRRDVKMPDAPESLPGQTFVAWVLNGKEYAAGAYIPAGLTADADGTIVEAKWSVNNYRITFDTSCSVSAPDSVSVQYEQTIPALADLSGKRENYIFIGWRTESNGGGIAVNAGDVFTWTKNIVLYAHWQLDPNVDLTYPFVINFLTNIQGVDGPASMTVKKGDNLNVLLPEATAFGQIFVGWFVGSQEFVTLDDCYQYLKAEGQNGISLIAAWTADPGVDLTYPFVVRFNSNFTGVASPSSLTVNQGDNLLQVLPSVTSGGYTFDGWFFENVEYQTVGDCHSYLYAQGKRSLLLTAKWTFSQFTVSFDANFAGVSNPSPVTVDSATNMATVLPPVSITGNTFLGWFIGTTEFKTLSDCFNYTKNLVNKDITLTAGWGITSFTVTFNANLAGVANPAPVTVSNSGTLPGSLPALTSSGINFLGWYIGNTKYETYDDCFQYVNTLVNRNITLTGKWEIDPFTVSFDAGAGVGNPASILVDSSSNLLQALPSSLTNPGYTFKGWFIGTAEFKTLDDCFNYTKDLVNKDITLTAKWEITSFKVSFNAVLTGLTNPATITVNNGSNLSQSIDDMVSAGSTFIGWYIGSTKFETLQDCFDYTKNLTAKDITLVAKWNIDPFTVSFDAGAGVISPNSILVDNNSDLAGQLPSSLSNPGYTLKGWFIGTTEFKTLGDCFNYSKSLINKDITLIAKWEVTSFVVSFNANFAGVSNPSSVTVNNSSSMNQALTVLPSTGLGYEFKGWFISDVEFKKLQDCFDYTKNLTNKNITLTAKWELTSFTIYFDANLTGVSVPAVFVNALTNLTQDLPKPTNNDNSFAGWYIGSLQFKTVQDCFNYSKNLTTNKDVALLGKWNAIPYTFTFEINHSVAYFTALGYGQKTYAVTVSNGNFNVGFPATTSPNWNLVGWKYGTTMFATGNLASVKALIPAGTYQVKLTAEFTEVVRTIHFNVNGGLDISSWNVTTADNTKKLPDAWREFYFLEGWYYNNVKVQTVGDILTLAGTNQIINLEARWNEGWVVRIWAYLTGATQPWFHSYSKWVVANGSIIVDTTGFGSEITGYKFSHWNVDGKNVGVGLGVNHQIAVTVTKHRLDVDAVYVK